MSPFECRYSIIEAFGEKVKAFPNLSTVFSSQHNSFSPNKEEWKMNALKLYIRRYFYAKEEKFKKTA